MRAGAPQEIGGYRILEPLGQGGMGAVYRAIDGDGREVALKLLHPHLGADDEARERLQREVASLQRVRHPGVARVLDAEIESSDAFVVTELVDGLDLAEHVRAHGRFDPHSLADLADQLREALAVVHEAGVLHRDLTPGNVMITDSGPVLIDFGIAQGMEDSRVTSAGLVAGTPGYVAPELLSGDEPSEQSDWWGWAALIAYAANGRPPFGTGPARAVLSRTRAGDVYLAGLAPRTEVALRGALALDPQRRPSPHRVVAELDRAAAGETEVGRSELPLWEEIGGLTPRTRVLESAPADDWEPAEDRESAQDESDDWSSLEGGAEEGEWTAEPDPYYREPPRRTGTVLAVGLALVTLGATRPGAALAIATGLAVVARSVGLDVQAVRRRRARRGPRPGDTTAALLAWPWYLARAALGVLPAALVAVSAVLLAGGIGWWLIGGGRWVVAPPAPGQVPGELAGNAPWVTTALVAAVVGVGLATLWFGPMSRASRVGARWAFAGPTGRVGAVTVTLAALIAFIVLLAVLDRDVVVWWPMSGPPGVA
jgi:hypothetical protein